MVSNVGIDVRKIDKKGRVVLPKYWLKANKLKAGMYVSVIQNDSNTSLTVSKLRIFDGATWDYLSKEVG